MRHTPKEDLHQEICFIDIELSHLNKSLSKTRSVATKKRKEKTILTNLEQEHQLRVNELQIRKRELHKEIEQRKGQQIQAGQTRRAFFAGTAIVALFIFLIGFSLNGLQGTITGAAIGPGDDFGTLALPVINSINLTATNQSLNNSMQNLTLSISTSDADNDTLKNMIEWKKNSNSLLLLNVPFEGSTNPQNATDYAGLDNNATGLVGSPTYLPTGGFDGSGAYNFSSNNEEVSLATTNFPTIGTGQYTLEAWIKTDATHAYNAIFSINTYSPGFYVSNDKLRVYHAGDRDSNTGLAIADNNWHHVAFVREGTGTDELKFYLDGVAVGSATHPGSIVAASNVRIGYDGYSGDDFHGTIDEVKFWNIALSAQQVKNNYENKTHLLDSSMTLDQDVWQGCSIPNDGTNDGVQVCSNTLQVQNNFAPTHATPLLNATDYPSNTTNANLTLYNQSTKDAEGDNVTNIISWKKNGVYDALLDVAFEPSLNAYNATNYAGFENNASSLSGSPLFLPTGGIDGKGAYNFSSDNEAVNLDTAGFPTIGTSNYTVSAWIKTSATHAYNAIFAINTYDPGFYVSNDKLRVYDSGDRDSNTGLAIADNNWHHVAFVREGTGTNQLKFYLDGVAVGSATHADSITAASNVRIGWDGFNGEDFHGTIDGVRVWNRSLSIEQIQAIYQNKTNTIVRNETTLSDQWQGCITPNDGKVEGETKCSASLTIIQEAANNAPSAPVLVSLPNASTTTNRTPTLVWNNSVDSDGDDVSYNIVIDDDSGFNNPEVNISGIVNTSSVNTSYVVATELDVDTMYYWKVRANDSTQFGDFSEHLQFTVDSYLAISIVHDTINFGSMSADETKNTTATDLAPFRVENVGNVQANITVSATPYFNSVSFPSHYYQFKIRANKSGAFNTSLATMDWTNVSNVTTSPDVVDLDWHSFKNDFLADLLVLIPSQELEGERNSSITFEAFS